MAGLASLPCSTWTMHRQSMRPHAIASVAIPAILAIPVAYKYAWPHSLRRYHGDFPRPESLAPVCIVHNHLSQVAGVSSHRAQRHGSGHSARIFSSTKQQKKLVPETQWILMSQTFGPTDTGTCMSPKVQPLFFRTTKSPVLSFDWQHAVEKGKQYRCVAACCPIHHKRTMQRSVPSPCPSNHLAVRLP